MRGRGRAGGSAIRRRVFYLPGFDERDARAYWGLYRRESRRTAERRGIPLSVGEPTSVAGGLALEWEIEAGTAARTTYTLLRWDDIVREHFPRSTLARLVGVPLLWGRLAWCGYLKAFARDGGRFSVVMIGVHLIFLTIVALALVTAIVATAWLPESLAPWPVRAVIAALLAFGLLMLAMTATRGKPLYVPHLVDDTHFTHRHAAGRVPAMGTRFDRFAEIIAADDGEWDEVVLVGHSSGSFLILEVIERVLARVPDFGRRGTPVTLITAGAVIPWVTLDPRAEGPRRALAAVAAASPIVWYDLAAWWDWLSVHGKKDPIRASGLATASAGRIRSVEIRLSDLIDRETRRRTNFNLFQRHFQVLMASRPHALYDYILLTAGPEPVRDFLNRCRAAPQAKAALRRGAIE